MAGGDSVGAAEVQDYVQQQEGAHYVVVVIVVGVACPSRTQEDGRQIRCTRAPPSPPSASIWCLLSARARAHRRPSASGVSRHLFGTPLPPRIVSGGFLPVRLHRYCLHGGSPACSVPAKGNAQRAFLTKVLEMKVAPTVVTKSPRLSAAKVVGSFPGSVTRASTDAKTLMRFDLGALQVVMVTLITHCAG